MAVREEIRLVLLFVCLLWSGNSINWQGTGNMTQDNTTFIWNHIKNLNKSKTYDQITDSQYTYLSNFVEDFSNALNNQWDKAWNVVIVYVPDNSDSVVYGYAFRDHWMWYNGFKMNDGYYVSFIIWKDYNCKTWTTQYQTFSGTTLDQTMKSTLRNIVISNFHTIDLPNDPWSAAQLYVKNMETTYSSNAFTIIVAQSYDANFFGRFCSVGYGEISSLDRYSQGKALLMQMR